MVNLQKKLKSGKYLKRISFVGILLLFFTVSAYSQTVVKGTVVDENSLSIPSANVFIQGTTTGTITDMDGNFSLSVKKGQIIEASFLGYKNATVAYTGQDFITIALEPDNVGLDEVVVIGFGVQKKSDLSGSVASVEMDGLQDIVTTDAVSMLKGKAAGVVISSTTGIPGDESSNTVRIRGNSSLTASNDPLYIIDGISGNINNINPNDIESIEILKDAASTAIYGAAGANGVILVTTKTGSAGKTVVNFSMQSGIQMKPEPIKLLSSKEEYDLIEELNGKGSPVMDIFSDHNYNDKENPQTGSRIDTTNWANVNWQDEIMQNSTFQEYNLSLSGGTEKTKYLVSTLYRKNEGILKTASAEQYGFRINLDNEVADNFSIKSNVNVSRRKRNPVADNTQGWNGALINSSFTYPNFIPIYDPNATEDFFINPLRPQFDNPAAWIRGKDQESTTTSLSGLLQFNWEIIDGLVLLSSNSLGYSASNSNEWLNPYDTYVGRSNQGVYSSNFGESMSMGTQNTLTWTKEFGAHNLSVMAGMVVGKGTGIGNRVKGTSFANDMIKEVTAAENVSGSSYHNEDFTAAYIGRINYSYADKYLAQFNMRADGSSRFGQNNRWGQFPSASVAWKVSEESFFKDNISLINFLKLRLGYGFSGNKPPQNFMYMALYGPQAQGWEDAAYPVTLSDALTTGYAIMRIDNPDLRWETTREINLGIDMNMFSNRLIMNTDIYSRDAYDLLYIFEPPVTYYDYSEQGGTLGGMLLNIGETTNKGVELGLTTKNFVGMFKWTTDVTFAYNYNEVVSLGDDATVNYNERQVVTPGYQINAFWGYEMDRLFQESDFDENGKLLEGIPSQPNVRPGDIKFKDISGDGIVNEKDKTFIGNPTPPITYSMTNTFKYLNIDLSIFLQGVQGNKIWNQTRETTEGMFDNLQQFATVLDRWTPENTDTDMPRAVLNDPAQNNRKSDRWIEDGSYLRLRDVVLGYTFPEHLLTSFHMQSARVYISARNLLTFTKYSGYDPEVRAVDFSGYPQNRTFVFGLNVSF